MDNEKQIEEMAKHCFFFEGGYCCTDLHISKMCEGESKDCGLYQTLENLHNAGYRKASEVAAEIFGEIDKLLDKHFREVHFINGTSTFVFERDLEISLAELKKKYIGEDTNVTTNTED